MMDAGPFDTPRMHLRPPGPRDEALYCALDTDPAVMAKIGPPLRHDAARTDFIAVLRCNGDPAGARRDWVVLDRGTREPLGLVALFRSATDRSDAEFGVMLLPGAQGEGRARELCGAVVARGFGPGGWGLRRLWLRHAPGHDAMVSMMAAAGFRPGAPVDGQATGEITRERWAGGNA